MGYNFNVNPVQVGDGTDYSARKDAAAARKIELQQRQLQLDQAKKAKADQDARDAAAKGAYQPSSYTPPAQSLNVGGANLGYKPAAVQGPAQFNRGSYLQSLQQSDPLGAMGAQQHFQQQDVENQKAQVAFQDSLTTADTHKLELAGKQLDLTARMLGGVKSAPPDLQAQVYQGVRQQAIQMGLVQPNDPQVPEQFPGAQWLDQKLQSTLTTKEQIDNENKRRDQQITMRGQDTTAATAQAAQAVTMRGQNMTDARSRDQNQIAREQKADLNRAADETQLAGVSASMDRLAAAANELKNHPGLGGITGISGALPNVPGGQAANAQAKLSTLKSQTAFSTLADLRNQSKTGGALGQISDKEEQMLSDNLAALDRAQSAAEYKKSLQAIIDFATAAKQRARDAVGRKYTSKPSLTNQGPAGGKTINYKIVNGQLVPE